MVIRALCFLLVAALTAAWVNTATPPTNAAQLITAAHASGQSQATTPTTASTTTQAPTTTTTSTTTSTVPDLAPSIAAALGRSLDDGLPRGIDVDQLTAIVVEIPADPQALWNAGYQDHGGQRLADFLRHILPCESGANVDAAFEAVGHNRTRSGRIWSSDHGRAQINDRYWKARFEELFGVDFDPWIYDPYLNGAMASVVEREQNIRAWTCARIAGLR